MSTSELILLSAVDATALKRKADGLADFLEDQPESLRDCAYTLAVGRKRFVHRLAIVIPPDEATGPVLRALERENTERTSRGAPNPPRVAFMFPGQGSQFISMGKELFEVSPLFRKTFEECDRILTPRLGLSLRGLLFECADTERDAETLRQTQIAQPALFVVEYCLARVLQSFGIEPDILIGHSIGEFAAACLGGVFELPAALELVAERGRLMQSQPSGSMFAVRSSPDALDAFLSENVTLAAHNAPELCVVSGAAEPMARFVEAATEAGLDVKELKTSHAFHSPMMDPILEPFREAVARAHPQPPRIPIVSTLTGELLSAEEATSADYWACQLRQAVRFSDGVKKLFDSADRVLLEVGPGTALTTSAAKQVDVIQPRARLETLGGPKEPRPAFNATLRTLGRLWIHGAELDWEALYDGGQRRLMRIPTYPFTRQLHWVEPPKPTGEAEARGIRIVGVGESEAPASGLAGTNERLFSLLGSRLGRKLDSGDFERSFVELGFDSLALSQLRARLSEQFGVDVSMRQLFEGQDTPQLLADFISEHPVAVVQPPPVVPAPVASGSRSDVPRLASEPPAPSRARFAQTAPTTEPQRELWVACATGGPEATLCYNECRRLDLRGALDEKLMEAALVELLRRHEALRQVFNADGSEFTVKPFEGYSLPVVDLRSESVPATEDKLSALCHEQVATAFDLERGPLFRAQLVLLTADHAVLLLCAHHIAADGSSIYLLLRELSELYSSFVDQRSFDLPPPDSYVSYAERAQDRELGPAGQADEKFWLEHLSGHTEDLDLPTDRVRPAVRSFPAERQDFYIDATTTEALRTLGLRAKTTLQTVLMASVQLLLHRVGRQSDIVLGMPASGQAAVGARALMGHCVHVLPIRQYLEPSKTFLDYLAEVRGTLLDCLEHQEITFSSYLEKLGRPRDPSRFPLVPFAFGMGRTPKQLPFSGLEVKIGTVSRLYETFEIYLFATEDGEGVNLAWSYNTDLFSAETIQAWQRCLETIIARVTSEAALLKMADLDVLSDRDREQLLRVAQGPVTPADSFRPAHERFAAWASQDPEAIAVIATDRTLTYGDLQRGANQLGQWLARRGMAPGSLVAVCLERSSTLVEVLMGVWMAGLAYVPLDPKYPEARVRMILEDSGAEVLLTSRDLVEGVVGAEPPEHVSVVLLEDVAEQLARELNETPDVQRSPSDRAYVIFTSGSTGRPKGVQISQQAFDNFLVSMAKEPGFRRSDRILALTTVSFDIAGLELFLPLVQGGSLVLVSADQAMDPSALSALVSDHKVSILQATPATWQMLLEAGWTGDSTLKVLCGGEAFPQKLAERLLESCGEIWNVYGPTETTVWSSVKQVKTARDLTIGRPIDNTTMYILDDAMKLTPTGSPGELWIGGRGVAAGYLGRSDLTAERFKSNPYLEGDVIYRTGDLGKVRRDGEFECLGRVDFQVKIRGFRIELGEIESALVKQPAVASAVVLAREDESGDKVLVAYVVPRPGEALDPGSLKAQVAELLPAYMVPSAYVFLDELPMTPNNKVDRKALPAPDKGADSRYEPPKLAREQGVPHMLWLRRWVDAPPQSEELPPCSWLLVGDDNELTSEVRQQLAKKGHTVTVVHARDRFHELGDADFAVNPEVGREHFEMLLDRLADSGRLPDRILHLWLANDETRARLGSSLYHHHQERGLYALMHLSALLGQVAPERAVTFHVALSALHREGATAEDRGRAAVLGLCRAISNESPRQKVSVFELSSASSLRRKGASQRIVAEVLRGPTERFVSLEGNKRATLQWERASAGANEVPAGLALIVGLSPIALAFARRLSSVSGVQVALVASLDVVEELRTEATRLKEVGRLAAFTLSDLSNHAEVQGALETLRRRYGPPKTVVLAAPEAPLEWIADSSEPDVESRLAPVTQVLSALDLGGGKHELMFINSTLHSELGVAGCTADAAASAVLNLERFHHRASTRIVACHWFSAREPDALVSGSASADVSAESNSQVALDTRFFKTEGLSASECEEAVSQLLGAESGVYAVCPYELADYQARLELSSARDANARTGGSYVEPKNEVERRLAKIWAEVLRLDRVGTEDSFFDLGGHSLLAVKLFSKVNREFNVALPLAVLFESPTIVGLSKHLGGDQPAGVSSESGGSRLLVLLHRGDDSARSPFFVVHGAFGNVLNLRHLARLLDSRRNFYAIQAQGLDGSSPPHETLREAAAAYVDEIHKVQERGPYLLGGFCVGGVVALEMARILRAEGEQVGLLAMLDSHLPEKRGTLSFRDRLQIQTERLKEGRMDYVRKWATDKYHYEKGRFRRKFGLDRPPDDATHYRSEVVHEKIEHGMRAYRPEFYDGQVVLFRPPLAPKHVLSGGRKINERRGFLLADNGWSPYVRDLELHELAAPAGDHDGFVLEPHVRDLARRLRPMLEKADRDSE